MPRGRLSPIVDSNHIYKLAYKQEHKWVDYLSETSMTFLNKLWKGLCVHPNMAMSSLMVVASCLAGPKAKIETHAYAKKSPLIMYIFDVCAPGGGKSTTYETIVVPAGEVYQKATGKSLLIENYTQAGLQTHQSENDGYGLLSSDEGMRVLQAIHGKQLKNEGERAFLCKSWNGMGDYTVLREQERGYSATALGMLLFLQPDPFLGEMRHFKEDDGFLDRICISNTKPELFTARVISQNAYAFNKDYKNVIKLMYEGIYKWHKDKVWTYKFDDEAQAYYDTITDEIVHDFNDMFKSGNLLVLFFIHIDELRSSCTQYTYIFLFIWNGIFFFHHSAIEIFGFSVLFLILFTITP